ncbi:MAG: hypothetical protein AVDCRST_MAG15-3228, partial [uncultured Rubellimicrobium sp.]
VEPAIRRFRARGTARRCPRGASDADGSIPTEIPPCPGRVRLGRGCCDRVPRLRQHL